MGPLGSLVSSMFMSVCQNWYGCRTQLAYWIHLTSFSQGRLSRYAALRPQLRCLQRCHRFIQPQPSSLFLVSFIQRLETSVLLLNVDSIYQDESCFQVMLHSSFMGSLWQLETRTYVNCRQIMEFVLCSFMRAWTLHISNLMSLFHPHGVHGNFFHSYSYIVNLVSRSSELQLQGCSICCYYFTGHKFVFSC